jgi:serine/threonine-protein kinase PknK
MRQSMDEIVLRNRYRVLRRLGAGGVGSVYMVEELRRTGAPLALKAVFGGDGQAALLGSLRLEFRVLANLRHPLLARVYDFGSIPASSGLPGADGRPGYFFTRELIEGQDLESYCRGLSVAEICRVCRDTAEVLDTLHRAGMVHGDFKPANVIVSPDGQPHLIDFGLVLREGQDSLPSGTAAYLAPETLRGQVADRRVDLYALGISIYQLVTGSLPRPEADLAELIGWHLEGAPLQLLPELEVPEKLDEVVQRLTERDPARRYPSAGEVALALADAAASAGLQVPATPQLFVPPAPGENLNEPLVELERAARRRTLQRQEGAAALMTVEGEPGAGKSALLQELAWRSQLAGIEVIRGEFRTGDRRALGFWSDLLDEIAGIVGTAHPLEQPPAGEIDRYALYQQICSYISASAARTPLLLLLDQAEQADEESRAVLRFIAHMLGAQDPVLLVVAHRRDEALNAQLDAPPCLRLRPLSSSDLCRMLADASGRQDDALAGRILSHTGGNPQFVLEVLRRLGEAGWPAEPDLVRLAPPRNLEEMYAARCRDLGEQQRALLEALAVLGRPASKRLLAAVLQRAGIAAPPDDSLPLPRLEQLEWVDRSPDSQYSFRQGPAASFVYGSLSAERRRALHLAAALELEQSGSTDAVERTQHALGADRLDLAERTLAQALSRLKSLGAHRVAIAIWNDVARLETDRVRQRAAHRELAELHRLVGEFDRAAQFLQQVIEGASGDERSSSRVALSRVRVAAGQAGAASELLDDLLAGELPPELRLQALSAKTMALATLDAHEKLLATALEGLQLERESAARGQPRPAVRAELQGQAAWSLGHLQRFDEAGAAFATALEDARTAGDPRVEATILNRWAAIAMRQGDHGQVPSRYAAALEGARRSGDLERVATIRYNLSTYHFWRAEYAAAMASLEESLQLCRAMGLQERAAGARCNLGLLELKLGLYERARADLTEGLEVMRRLGRRSGEALALAGLALAVGHRGKLAEARTGIEEARRLYLEIGQQRDAAEALLDLAELEVDAGQLEAAREAVAQARAEVDLEQTLDLKVRAAALQARLAARGGNATERVAAAEVIEGALLTASELGSLELSFESAAAAMELSAALGQNQLCLQHAHAAAEILEQMARDLPPECRAAFWQDPRRLAVRELVTPPAGPEERMPDQGKEQRRRITGAQATVQPARPPGASLLGATLPSLGDSGVGPALATATRTNTTTTQPPLRPTSTPRSGSILLAAGEERVRLVEERFYRLLEIYRQVNSELDPERLLGLVMDTAVELTGAERGFLLLGPSPDDLKVEVARNLDVSGEVSSYSRSIAERVFSSGQPVVTVSARNDPRFREYLSVHQLQLESVLCIPIHARGRVAGVLYMESRFQTGRFTPADQRLLMAFGDQVAIALTNARLMSENLRKTRELEKANLEIEGLAEERGRMLRQRTEELEEAQRDLADAQRRLESRASLFGMVGRSAGMARLFELMERVAATDVPILIEGESGTGKEMVARGIHHQSQRRKGRLVSVNCAAIPESLLESELFGHVRGAFTGADRERKGLFAAAHGGTLFLDEIGDMPTRMQVDLLRALQEKTIRPVGAQEDIKVDVRVIAASNKPLPMLVQQGKFREDLYYRLNVVTLRLPPLRERTDDIPLLCDHLLAVIGTQMKTEKKKITRAAMRRLVEYSWPGNVRQLEHALMNAAVLADRDVLDEGDFALEAPAVRSAPPPAAEAALPRSEEDRQARERRRMLEALESCNWNKSRAAELMGMPRRTFYRRLKLHSIQ